MTWLEACGRVTVKQMNYALALFGCECLKEREAENEPERRKERDRKRTREREREKKDTQKERFKRS